MTKISYKSAKYAVFCIIPFNNAILKN